ncbi:alpha-L-rhamnosidase N-terminal domain-containing protein [Bifidobacterium avesanii]|uniref:alpha-L-rhamnosidase n=1 Tax=Bifidobacterium avesanii TaxID=1798157 RepID=A0A7K3TIK5_9BIFI|nr:alpha-L-rhamnosidase N-terminal domain-containing protein [Bifidobacterium avesanii]KAB8292668.1 alpha-L-rhamnosidase [Bifidobacterium avesanii]NEG78504.1 Bacterial alpha-L-rhamnosidase [Bifidobacterium avesanii]
MSVNSASACAVGRPYGLTADDAETPWNASPNPRFAWMMEALRPGAAQSAYEIAVEDGATGGEVWRSGRVESAEQSNVRYAGPALEHGRPYAWRVRVWDRDGVPTPFSEPAWFAVGLDDGEWDARWIESARAVDAVARWVPASEDGRGPAGYEPGRSDTGNVYWRARRTAALKGDPGAAPVVRALVYVCCAHDYELRVNGKRIGRGQNFDYPSESRYQAWDATEAVAAGDGTLALDLTCRWYGGGQGRCPDTRPALLLHAVVWRADGSREDVVSDGSWTVAPAPYGGDVLRNGEGDFVETYDANAASDGDEAAGRGEPALVLGAHPCPEMPHVVAELGHVTDLPAGEPRLTTLGDGTVVADFGKIVTGRFSVDFPAVAGTGPIPAMPPLTLWAGYELDADGRVKTGAGDPANQGSDLRFVVTPPRDGRAFTYDAWDTLCFRYLMVPPADGKPALAVRARVVHAEVPSGGEARLETSDPTLDRVFALMAYSALNCTTNQFLDTPTRERGQFLADGFNISRAAMAGWRERATTAKAIRQFLDSQTRWWSSRPEDSGKYNSVYPNVDLGRDIPDFSLMMPRWVREYYMQTGDLGLVREAMPYLERTADYPLRAIPADGPLAGLVVDIDGGGTAPKAPYFHGIVDWPQPGRFGYDMACPARTVINALSYRVLDDVAWLAGAVGDAGSAARRRAQADALREAMNAKLLNADGVYVDGLMADGTPSGHAGQHASSFPLAFGVAPDDEAARARLAGHVAAMGMRQGPMTADVLVKSLCDNGRRDAALRLLTNADDWGWAELLRDRDATFTWEQWQYPAPGGDQSESHGWGAAALQYVVERILGVEVVSPGAAVVRVDPALDALGRIDGTVVTQRGPVRVLADRGAGTLHVELPANVTGVVALPGGEATVTGGTHDFAL